MKKKLATIFFSLFFIWLFAAEPVLAVIKPNDFYYRNQWYLAKVQADSAWNIISSSPDIVVAVIDGRVQTNHPDLKNNIWTNRREVAGDGVDNDRNGFIDDKRGWNFVDNQPSPPKQFDSGWTEAGVSHGTMVAGIIAAEGNNQIGITGVTFKAQIMPLRVLNDRGQGKVSDVIRAIDYATNNGADIINLSFVSFKYSEALQEAIARAHQAGVIVVAAAGNEQANGSGYNIDQTPIYPACYDGSFSENMVIGVAATDALDQKTKFSSYGSRCVDITAPGISFFSTITAGSDSNDPAKLYEGYWSGTSMAAPVVSGALALIEEADPKLKPQEAVNILFASAHNINRLNPDYIGKLGNGRLDVFKAVEMAKAVLYQKVARLVIVGNKGGEQSKLVGINGNLVQNLATSTVSAGSNVASGDLNEDNNNELVVGAAKGEVPKIFVLDGQGKLETSFLAFPHSFRGGVNVAVADLNGNGQANIIATPESNGPGKVRIFSAQGKLIREFMVDSKAWRGGLSVAAGDLDGKQNQEIVVGYSTPGQSPVVKIFTTKGKILSAFYAYEKNFRGGVKVAVTNLYGHYNRGQEQIIVAPGPGRNPQIRIYNNRAILLKKFLAYKTNWQGGVNLTAGDTNNNGRGEIILGAEPGADPHVRIFDGQGILLESFYAWPAGSFSGGANVGIINLSSS